MFFSLEASIFCIGRRRKKEGKEKKILDGGLSNYFKKAFQQKILQVFMMGFPTSTRSCFKIFLLLKNDGTCRFFQ